MEIPAFCESSEFLIHFLTEAVNSKEGAFGIDTLEYLN